MEAQASPSLSQQFVEIMVLLHNNFGRQTQVPLPLNQFGVLCALMDTQGMAIIDLSRQLNISKQQMTTVIDIYTADAKYSEKLRAALNAVEYILNMRYVTSLREDAGGTYGASVSTSLDRIPSPKAELQISFNSKPASADHLRELAAKGFKELAEQVEIPL